MPVTWLPVWVLASSEAREIVCYSVGSGPCLRMRLILIFSCRPMSCVSDGTCICGLER